MKKLFKFASYTLLYILITFASAFGVVFLSSNSGSEEGEDDGFTIPPQLTQIMERLTSANALDIDLKVDIETYSDKYTLVIDAIADLSNGLENAEVQGDMSVFINEDKLIINMTYSHGTIYMNMFNGQFKIETANITDSISQILSLLQIEIPELGMDFSSFDTNMILSMLSNITETSDENSITLKISLPIVGDLEIVCDLNYSINQIYLPKVSIEGTQISLFSNIEYPDSISISEPSKDNYMNITDIVDIANTLLNYLNSDEIGLDIALTYKEQTFTGNLSANLKDMSSKFTTKLLGYDLNLTAIDNIIYFEFGNIFAKYDLNEVYLINDLLQKHFGIEVPLEKITDILVSLNEGNLTQTIQDIFPEGTSTSIDSIDLSILESFSKNGNNYTFKIKDIGEVSCSIENNTLKSVSFAGFDIKAELKTTNPKQISISNPVESYINLKNLIGAIDSIMEMKNYNRFDGIMNLVVGQTNFDINYSIYLVDNDISAILSTEIYGKQLNLYLKEQTIFIDYSGLKISADINDTTTLVNWLEKLLNINIEQELISNLQKTISEVLNPALNPTLVNSINLIEGGVAFDIMNSIEIELLYENAITSVKAASDSFKFEVSLTPSNNKLDLTLDKTDYLSLSEIINLIDANYDSFTKENYAIEISGNYEDIIFNGGINYYDSKITASIAVEIQENTFAVKFIDNVIYLEIDDLNLSVSLDDKDLLFNFIKEKFNIDLQQMLDELLNNTNTDSSQINIEEILRDLTATLTSNNLSINFGEISANVNFENYKLEDVNIKYSDKLNATIKLLDNKYNFELDNDEYFNVSSALPFVNAIIDYIETKKYNVQINAFSTESSQSFASGLIQADLTDKLKFNAKLTVGKEQEHNIEASVFEDYLYANYNDLLLKIKTADLEELMVIAMQMLGIDPNLLPFLQDVANGMDLDMSGLEHLFPTLDTADPLAILKIFKGISVKNDSFEVKIDSSILGQTSSEPIVIKVQLENETLKSISIENLVFDGEKVNLNIIAEEFIQVDQPDTTKNYIDISNANQLIKAIINTSELDYYELAGTLNIKLNVIGIDINMDVPFNFQVKLVDRVPEIMATIGKIPVIAGANDDTPYEFGNVYAGTDRMAYIYFKDENLYIYRTENVPSLSGTKTYERKIKAHYTDFLADPMMYLQFITGFSDTIMAEINKAIETSMNRTTPIDVSNIIKEFTVNDNASNYTVKLNLAELANNPDLDSITISLKTENNETTNNKDYLSSATLDMYMPIANAFTLNLISNDLHLVDIGKELDFTKLYDFVNSYNYGENESWHAINGNWQIQSTKQYTITFDEQGGNDVADITANVDSPISLPVLDDKVVVDYQNMTQTTYTFEGWYTSLSYAEDTLFDQNVMPRFGAKLYAKWREVSCYKIVTITFDMQGGYSINSSYAIENSYFDTSVYSPSRYRDASKGDYNWVGSNVGKFTWTVTRYTFAGWYLDSSYTTQFNGNVGNENITLFAKWDAKTTTEYYYNWEEPA